MTSVDPATGAQGVSVSVAPVLVFNVPVEAASVSTSTIKLKKGDKVLSQAPGSPALCTCGENVTITAAGLLDPNTVYTIAVKGGDNGVQSLDGSVPGKAFSSTFTTETALAGSDPAAGATGVATTVTPTLTFKWPLDSARVDDTTFQLKDITTGKVLSLSSVTLGLDGMTVTITPTVALKTKHEFKIRVLSGSGGLRFTDGRVLGKDIKIGFKSAAT